MELVDRYGPLMLRIAMSHVPTRAIAEDVVGEAWLGVLQGLPRFEGRSSLKTWILRIVANHVVAAVILNDNGIVWEAAPILRYRPRRLVLRGLARFSSETRNSPTRTRRRASASSRTAPFQPSTSC